jgi:beta-N-acetylhexosaminidase
MIACLRYLPYFIIIAFGSASCEQSVAETTPIRLADAVTLPDARTLSYNAVTDKAWLAAHYADIEKDTFLYRTFFEKTLTLVQNVGEKIPFRRVAERQFTLVYAAETLPFFEARWTFYAPLSVTSAADFKARKMQPSDEVILIFAGTDLEQDAAKTNNLLKSFAAVRSQVTILNVGNPNNLRYFTDFHAVIQIYEKNAVTEDVVAQLLFGGTQAAGQLPVTINERLPKGIQNAATPIIRLGYNLPESVGMQGEQLHRSIAQTMARAIRKKALPGGQILVAKAGKVVYYQAFGTFGYNDNQAVQPLDLYDLASVTKVAATTLAMMRLHETGTLQLEERLKTYLQPRSNIAYLRLRHLLTHRSGLPSSPNIYRFVRVRNWNKKAHERLFNSVQTADFSVKITDELFMDAAVQDEFWTDILRTRARSNASYLYSDINFLLLQKVIETQTAQPLDVFLDQNFYRPLGLQYLTFNPLNKFSKNNIAPTVYDDDWRKILLQGEVHDEVSALLGGVAGNSGLFGNANDLAIVFQLLLNGGEYGGERLLQQETIDFFVNQQQVGRRALGFDRRGAGCYSGASRRTFGHSGFTGTCVWADPDADLIYIFLSNRVHPNPKNHRLSQLKTRELVHRAVYQ